MFFTIILSSLIFERCDLSYDGILSIQFECNGTLNQVDMNAKDIKQVVDILSGKIMFRENLSCGFSDNLAIIYKTDEKLCVFQIAFDGCPYLYETEGKRYVKLSANELELLHSILKEYVGRYVTWTTT